MTQEDVYLTAEGHEKLMAELEYLERVKRRQISKAIEHARGMGDLKENAEYDSAKNEQARCEERIAHLKAKLSRARIIDANSIPSGQVFIGAKVLLLDMDTQEQFEYTLVSKEEADYDAGKISLESPVGSALLTHKIDDIVEIKVPAGILKYKILKIGR